MWTEPCFSTFVVSNTLVAFSDILVSHFLLINNPFFLSLVSEYSASEWSTAKWLIQIGNITMVDNCWLPKGFSVIFQLPNLCNGFSDLFQSRYMREICGSFQCAAKDRNIGQLVCPANSEGAVWGSLAVRLSQGHQLRLLHPRGANVWRAPGYWVWTSRLVCDPTLLPAVSALPKASLSQTAFWLFHPAIL